MRFVLGGGHSGKLRAFKNILQGKGDEMILSFKEWPSGRLSKPQPWPGVAAAFLYSSEPPDSHPGEGRSADLVL